MFYKLHSYIFSFIENDVVLSLAMWNSSSIYRKWFCTKFSYVEICGRDQTNLLVETFSLEKILNEFIVIKDCHVSAL